MQVGEQRWYSCCRKWLSSLAARILSPIAGNRKGAQDTSLTSHASHLSVACDGIISADTRDTTMNADSLGGAAQWPPHGGVDSWIAQDVYQAPATTQTTCPHMVWMHRDNQQPTPTRQRHPPVVRRGQRPTCQTRLGIAAASRIFLRRRPYLIILIIMAPMSLTWTTMGTVGVSQRVASPVGIRASSARRDTTSPRLSRRTKCGFRGVADGTSSISATQCAPGRPPARTI